MVSEKMFSAISAYFFGEDDLQPNFEGLNEIEDEDNEWIFVDRVTQQGQFLQILYCAASCYRDQRPLSYRVANGVYLR